MFEDRVDAGRRLAKRLERYHGPNALVLAIPRGGVVIGYQVAAALCAPMDVVVPRKIGAPGQPEFAIGAVGDDEVVLDELTISQLHVSQRYLDEEIERQKQEIVRRMHVYRGDKPFPDLSGKTAILVDDGMATGATTLVAARAVRARRPGKLILAVPVAPRESIEKLRPEVDEIIVLESPEPFYAVGAWYAIFDQTTDDEVIELLGLTGRMARA